MSLLSNVKPQNRSKRAWMAPKLHTTYKDNFFFFFFFRAAVLSRRCLLTERLEQATTARTYRIRLYGTIL